MFYHYSKQNSNTIKKSIFCLLIAGVIFVFAQNSVHGQTANDLQQQKEQKQQELNAIQSKIKDLQNQIRQVQGQANTLKNQVSLLNLQIVETQAQIDATANKIEASNLEIADVTAKIVKTQADIEKEKSILKALVTEINDLDQRSPLEIALENDNFQQFLDQVQYTESIQQQSQQTLTKIKQLKADLDQREADLKVEKSNLDSLLAELDQTKASLNSQQKNKQLLLDQTRGQERTFQKLLSISEEQQKALFDEINTLDDQIAARLGNRRLRAIHGLLAWPMDGTLTQGYGNTGFRSLGYSFHNGIDLAGPPGTPIFASGDGSVIATGTGNGAYGNWVAIKHNTGKFAGHPIITLYGHMSSIRAVAGQTIKQGSLVGFEGNTGNTTKLLYGPHRGYHVHFTIFDAEGFGINDGKYTNVYGPYQVPYGATYNPLDFL